MALKTLIAAELVSIAADLLSGKQKLDAALKARNDRPSSFGVSDDFPRQLTLTMGLGAELLILEHGELDALVTLQQNLAITRAELKDRSGGLGMLRLMGLVSASPRITGRERTRLRRYAAAAGRVQWREDCITVLCTATIINTLITGDATYMDVAHVGISDGAEGTTLKCFMAGVPQVILPWHVAAFMAARKIESGVFGQAIIGLPSELLLYETICQTAARRLEMNPAALLSASRSKGDQDSAACAVLNKLRPPRAKPLSTRTVDAFGGSSCSAA